MKSKFANANLDRLSVNLLTSSGRTTPNKRPIEICTKNVVLKA